MVDLTIPPITQIYTVVDYNYFTYNTSLCSGRSNYCTYNTSLCSGRSKYSTYNTSLCMVVDLTIPPIHSLIKKPISERFDGKISKTGQVLKIIMKL